VFAKGDLLLPTVGGIFSAASRVFG